MKTDQTVSEQPWYKDGLQFECTGCGRCCGGGPGYVWVTQEEIDRLAAKLGLSSSAFEQDFVYTVRRRVRSLCERDNYNCVLLDETSRKCTAYEERPIQCKTWPFWPHNLDTPQSWKIAAKVCPGCNHGQIHSLEEIEEQKNKTIMY